MEEKNQSILARDALNLLSSIRASLVNVHLYPQGSNIVAESIAKALDELKQTMEKWGAITLGESEGKLLVNDYRLEEREQNRTAVVSFLKDLSLWDVRSLTFNPGLSEEEFRDFVIAFSKRLNEGPSSRSLAELLEEAGVSNIKVDEKVYVPLSKGEDIEALRRGGGGPAQEKGPMDFLKEEIFVRYLLGKVQLAEVGEEGARFLRNPKNLDLAFQEVLRSLEPEEGVMLALEKAQFIRETIDRMHEIIEGIQEEEAREALVDEMARIISALEPQMLVEMLTEEKPEVVKDQEFRREVLRSLENEKVVLLTEQVVNKYKRLIAEKNSMPKEQYQELLSILNQSINELYSEAPVELHPEITLKLRESGVLEYLIRNHPRAGMELDIYAIISDLRSTGDLRVLEERSDLEVAFTLSKLFVLGEDQLAGRIMQVVVKNLSSERWGNRMKSLTVLNELYGSLRETGRQDIINQGAGKLLSYLESEEDEQALRSCACLLGNIANDLFLKGRKREFMDLARRLLSFMDSGDRRYQVLKETFLALHKRDVGRPLVEALFGEDQEDRRLAARILAMMDRETTLLNLVLALKEDQPRPITQELAELTRDLGKEAIAALSEELEKDNLEEIYRRVLDLLDAVGGADAELAVKRAATNPIPTLRAHALRVLSRIGFGDSSLIPLYLEALKDQELEVRRAAIRGLGTIKDKRSEDTLVGILHGKGPRGRDDPRVEEAVCLALTHLKSERAVPLFLELIRRKGMGVRRRPIHPIVKASACYGLAQLGGAEVAPHIRVLLEDEDPIVRNEAIKAMKTLRQRGLL